MQKIILASTLVLAGCNFVPEQNVPHWTHVYAYSWCIPHQGLARFGVSDLGDGSFRIGATCNDGTIIGGVRSAASKKE